MGKNIMVYIETADNSPINVSLEALTLEIGRAHV